MLRSIYDRSIDYILTYIDGQLLKATGLNVETSVHGENLNDFLSLIGSLHISEGMHEPNINCSFYSHEFVFQTFLTNYMYNIEL